MADEDLKRLLDEKATDEMRHFFEVSTEATCREIRLVAEGLRLFREELVRMAANHDAKIDRIAAETQAMIKALL